MLKILNEYYYLDLDKMEELVNIPTKEKSESVKSESVKSEGVKSEGVKSEGDDSENEELDGMTQHISIVKYDMLKVMIDVLMTESEEVDEKLGPKSTEISIPFKLAFNTLLNKKIINKY
jgi:hypothetical protein